MSRQDEWIKKLKSECDFMLDAKQSADLEAFWRSRIGKTRTTPTPAGEMKVTILDVKDNIVWTKASDCPTKEVRHIWSFDYYNRNSEWR